MSYRAAILSGASGTPTWSIPLATHLGTAIENSTTEPVLALAGPRLMAEARYAEKLQRRRPPIAGYNCFGLAFALRRTAIYEIDRSLLDTLLDDDGYAPVAEEVEVGDVVVYFDDRAQPFHAGVVVRHQPLLVGLASSTVPIVLSKLDDVSGEYEHKIDEALWPGLVASRMVYRARQRAPRRKWRDIIAAP